MIILFITLHKIIHKIIQVLKIIPMFTHQPVKVRRFQFSLFLFGLLLLGGLSSCRKDQRAEAMPESVKAYVYAYSSGLLSKNAPVRVQFASQVVSEDQVGKPAGASILTFRPAVKGKAVWENRHTIRFDPDPAFKSGQVYVVAVELEDLFDNLPADAHAFEFDFRTRDQFYTVHVDELYAPDARQRQKQTLKGSIVTADEADPKAVESLLKARQNRRDLAVSWSHDAAGLVHAFAVKGIDRGAEPGAVKLSWNGDALDVDVADERTIEVPALNDFKVTRARSVAGADPYLEIQFSDPLDPQQDLQGLITVSNATAMRYVIDGQTVRAYPQERLRGRQTINAAPGILNTEGKRMAKASRWPISIDTDEPQVRLTGRGVILPGGGEGQLFPFEAVGLNAVEIEVFKIFHNNILQFLQTNDLDGQYDLHRVGRVILRKKIPLEQLRNDANPGEWNRYALDLSTLFKQDDKAIYQVRIGFRKTYSTYTNCEDQTASSDEDALEISDAYSDDDLAHQESFMDMWYGIDGYYEDYDWSDRDNPCKAAYYNSSRFVQRNVLSSNLGIITKGSGDGKSFLSVVTNLQTAQPESQVKLQFYDYQLQLLGEAATDGQGIARIALEREPFVVVAQKGEQRGYLRLADGESLSLSRFDVAGATPQRGLKGFLYGERGVWRPGDSVFLNFILEDRNARLPAGYPIQFELLDARGQLRERRVVGEPTGRIYPLYFSTRPDDATGIWLARVKVGGAVFEKSLRIETIKPNRLKINLNIPGDALRGGVQAQINAQWLHGAPASDLKADVEANFREDRSSFKGFEDYSFSDPARSLSVEPATVFEGNLNGQGQASFELNPPAEQLAPGKMTVNLRTRVFEQGGDFSTYQSNATYYPYNAYAGVALPRSRYGEKRVDINKAAQLRFALLDAGGRPIAGRRLSVGLYRLEWRWWWDETGEDVSQYNNATHMDALSRQEVTTGSDGKAAWSATVSEWGRYLVRVCDTESGHCSGDYFYAGYPWYGEDEQYPDEAAMMMFSADKKKYNVGETVKLTIPAAQDGRVLVTLENGSGVIEAHWMDAKAGDNTYTFKTASGMAPTVYAHVIHIQPHGQAENNLPIRLYGVIPIAVEDPATRLEPRIAMAEELRPEAETTITVSENAGREMSYTLAIVDEGLLGLTNFKTPDPWGVFYAREALGVKTWDVFDQVLGAHGSQMARILGIGGDGATVKRPDADKANRFKPVVIHLGPFHLAKGQRKAHKIRLPNYIGAVRVMVVAEQGGAYGNAEKSVPVRKPLMVLATLPRVLGPGETLELPVSVFATTSKVRSATVRLEEKSGLVRIEGGASQSVSFSRPGDKLVRFNLAVGENVGVARFSIVAEGAGERATEDIEIQVRNPNPMLSRTAGYILEPGQETTLSYQYFGTAGDRSATLEVANMPPINLGSRLQYLTRYPYGCLEQTLSGAFPQLYLAKLIDLPESQKEKIPRNISGGINRLSQFQVAGGGFGYWPGSGEADQWATSYAGHFLIEAQSMGYNLPPAMLDRWISFQQAAARKWDPSLAKLGYVRRESYELSQAYRLYTLALARKPELGAMNQLRAQAKLGAAARWRLAAAYALAGQSEPSRELIRNLDADVPAYRELFYTYGSDTRDRAMILEALLLLKDQQRAGQLVQRLAKELNADAWMSTQETAFALMAISKFVGEAETSGSFSFSYQDQGQSLVTGNSDRPLMQVQLRDPGNSQQRSIKVKNTSRQKLFVTIITEGQPLTGEEQPRSSNLRLSVRYTDTQGNPINVAALPQGTDFIAEVTVVHPAALAYPFPEMALRQVFPSGWEIGNARMDALSAQAESSMDYRDYRDDRVHTFFDLPERATHTYRVSLTAAYRGRFYLPAVTCAAMYDNSIYANSAGEWVEVVAPKGS